MLGNQLNKDKKLTAIINQSKKEKKKVRSESLWIKTAINFDRKECASLLLFRIKEVF